MTTKKKSSKKPAPKKKSNAALVEAQKLANEQTEKVEIQRKLIVAKDAEISRLKSENDQLRGQNVAFRTSVEQLKAERDETRKYAEKLVAQSPEKPPFTPDAPPAGPV